MCWAIPLGQHINAQVQWSRSDEDPPDVNFHIRGRDGTEVTVWGEVTGAYYNSNEAKWLWGARPGNREGGGYWEPDAVLATKARKRVQGKRKKYLELV